MNIFYVDDDPVIAAQSLVNKHVVKMIVETSQLLSTAHRVLDGQMTIIMTAKKRRKKHWCLPDYREAILYKATHVNHPSAVWTRASTENYKWLLHHLYGLLDEYTHRYNKTHKCEEKVLYLLEKLPTNLTATEWTQMPCCMPEQYIISADPVTNYRQYYNFGKSHLHAWKNRDKPGWII